ncbi:MAG TPA: hotdog domain-containing protein [Jatrophihabitantaceae bacterium]|nr:hotdog domain-containing protein [Jatrophihabitantaceae bacterium]
MTSEQNRPWPDDQTLAELVAAAHPRGGDAYADLLAANRSLQDALSGASLPDDEIVNVTEQIERLTAVLSRYQVPESQRVDGWRLDLPGRGHPLLPPFVIEHEADGAMRGHVTFTRFYLGGNGAAHGGATPLLFDDLLGKVVNFNHRDGVARTAYLTVNYRSIARIGERLLFDAGVDKVEGRKIWGSARLTTEDGTAVADGEGLFIRLRPGQP